MVTDTQRKTIQMCVDIKIGKQGIDLGPLN